MFKNVFKRVKSLFLVSLLILSVLAILTLGPVPAYPTPVETSTYYEGSTNVVNGTALNSTSNLDANDGSYFVVDPDSVTTEPSETLTYSSTVSAGTWTNVAFIDANDVNRAEVSAKGKTYWVEMDDPTISGTISSVVIKIDCYVRNSVDPSNTEFTLGFSIDGSTNNLLTQDIDVAITEATYSWNITDSISSWTDLNNLRLSTLSTDPGKGDVDTWYVDYHRVEIQSSTTSYEVNVEHTSEQFTPPVSDITQIYLEDNFKFDTTVTAYLEWYNWTANDWATINSGSVGTSEVTWNKTWTSRFIDVVNSTGYMKVRIYTSDESSTHSLSEDHLFWNVTYYLPDVTSPTWSNAGTNNTIGGQPTLFYVKWADNVALSGFVFGTNNTGTWANDTWTSMNGTTDWSNVTKILTSSPGAVVQWRVWANDTSNNWNDTGILSLTTPYPPVASFTESATTVLTGETISFNASASYDPDGYITRYFWDFGDGTNMTQVTIDNTVSAASPYITVLPTSTKNGSLTPGTNYTISIYTDYNGSDVYSYQFNLDFDAGILHGGLNKTDTLAGDGTTTYTTTEYPVYPPEKISVNGSSMRKVTEKTDTWTGNNVTKTFFTTETPLIPDEETVSVNGTELTKYLDYVIDYVTGNITIHTAPASGVEVKAVYDYGDYTLGYDTGTITFTIAPGVGAAIKANYYHGGVVNGDLITTDVDPFATFIPGRFNNTSGELELTGALFYFFFEPAPITSGPGTLANVTFTVVGSGETNITLGPETMLLGYTGDGYGDQYEIIHAEDDPTHIGHGYFKNAEGGDVAVTDVMQWFRAIPVTNAAYSTWPINLNVTVENVGGMTVSCNVTVYYDSIPIATQTATDLVDSEIRTLTLTGDITGLDPGKAAGVSYTLKANATIIGLSDMNLANNEFAYGTVKVRRWGDVDDTDTISILDLKKVKLDYSNIIYEDFADLDGNDLVNILDLKKMKLIYSGILP